MSAEGQNAYQVNFFDTICVSFSDTQNQLRRIENRDTASLFEGHSVSNSDTPPIENTVLARAAAASDFDLNALRLIDQVFSTKPQNFDKNTLLTFRRWLHSYMAKCGRNAAGDRYQPGNPPPAPTDKQVAQVLAVADERTLTRALEHLLTENHEPYTYFWFVATLLHRIHGISIDQRKKGTQILVDVKRQAKQKRVDAGESADKQFTEQLILDAVSGVKRL